MINRLYTILTIAFLTFGVIQNPSYARNNVLPDIGSNALSTISYEKEKILGDILMRQTRARMPVDYDPLISEYVNALGNKLVTYADDIHFPFNFFVVKDKNINAFAFFGGNVAVNTGLISMTENESELASVLTHEISHVTQRHLSRRFESQKLNSPLTLAGLLGGVILAILSPEAGMATIMATQAGAAQASINFTRANEKEADRIGIKILAIAGFDPYAAPSFFDKLGARFRYTSTPPAFLMTHPLPESRVADSRLRAQQFPRFPRAASLDFQLVKSRIKARYELKPKEAVKYFKNMLKTKNYVLIEAAQYGLALAYTDSDQLKKAEAEIQQLLFRDAKNLYYIDTYTDIFTKMQKFDTAIAFLERHYKLRPNNPVVTLNYASVAIEAKRPQIAVDLLNRYTISHGQDYIATDLLTTAYGQMKNLAKYHEMRAQTFALISLYDQSIEELKLSLAKLGDDKILESKRLIALQKRYRDKLEQIKQL
ncbi:MAG: M48 family metalloprotease [Psychrosphaera sp.]|nr:M48 family metalloprotease [Psychrosphaera sp.]